MLAGDESVLISAFEVEVAVCSTLSFFAGSSPSITVEIWLMISVAESATLVSQFVSLFAGILQTNTSEHLSREDQENADRSLRQLAGEVDLLLPTTRHFPDDPEKASQVAALLTALVNTYSHEGPGGSSPSPR